MPDLQAALAELDDAALTSLRGAGLAGVPHLPASNEGLEGEFLARAYDYTRRWLLDKNGPVLGANPCAFVLSRAINQDVSRLEASIIHYLNSTVDAEVCGGVFITNEDFSIVARLPHQDCGDLRQIVTALRAADLHAEPHTVFRPSRGELILCKGGVLGKNSCVPIVLDPHKQLSASDLERHIWEFHRQYTQTPSGDLLPWKGAAANRITIEALEVRISKLLTVHLRRLVGLDNVRMEEQTSHGRVDVSIVGAAMASGVGGCALELKVLRSKKTAGARTVNVTLEDMLEYAKEGIGQAVEYRQDVGANLAYLCCFDARLIDEDQPEVIALGKSKNVEVRRYFMYASTAEHRAAKAAADKAGLLLAGEVD
ncbi:MAG: hypothetical protein K2Y04_01270 [Caulobacteraceae bacterium]|nr:hypothetical protein [Caulobacteraceae bacterium]